VAGNDVPDESKRMLDDLVWSKQELRAAQLADSDIKVVAAWLSETTEKPPWERVAIYSGTTKALWHQWSRLCLREGVLYRKFWSADGLSISLQLVVPYQYRVEFIRLPHENIREVTSAGDAQKLKSKREAIGLVGQKTSVVFLRTCRPCM